MGEPPRGAACWLEVLGLACWPFLLDRQLLGARLTGETSCQCFFACVWLCSGVGGRCLRRNGFVMGDPGGALPWRARAPDCCSTLISRRVSPPFLFLLFGLSFLLPYRVGARQNDGANSGISCFVAALNRMRIELPWIGTFAGVAALVAAPLLIYFALHPEHLIFRSGSLSVFQPDQSRGDQLRVFLANAWEHLSVLGFRGDPSWLHNFAGRPMLNPWEAFFFWLGVGMAVWRWQRRPAYRLLLLWTGVLLLPAMLAKGDVVPNTMRMIGATPAIYLLVAVGMWELFRFLWDRFFRESETRAAIVMGVAASGLILTQGAISYRTYFQKWAVEPEVYRAHDVEWANLARLLNAQSPGADTVYLIPNYDWHFGFEYLYQGAAPAHVFHTIEPGLGQKIESALSAMQNFSTVKVVEWDANAAWVEGRTSLISVFLDKYGRYQGSEEFPDFQIHTYTDVALGRPWTLYEQLESLTVEYDGGIALQGFTLGQGKEQLSSEQLLSLGEDHSLWMALRWQLAPGLDIDYAISVRLHDAEEEKSTRGMLPFGSRTMSIRAVEAQPQLSIPWSNSIFQLVSSPPNTSCGWSSTTPRL